MKLYCEYFPVFLSIHTFCTILVCDAMNKAVITTDGFYNGSFNEMFTSNGQTFLPTHSGYARFILTLSGKATNIAKVSFTIHKAFNVIVAFTNGTQNFTRLVSMFIGPL